MKKRLLLLVFALSFSFLSYSQIGISQPSDLEVCDTDGDGIGFFDFTILNTEILNGLDPASYDVSYHLTLEDAENQTNPLEVPFANTSNPQTIYVSVFEPSTGNYEITSFLLIVNSVTSNGFATEQIQCGTDGFSVFDLTTSIPEITGGNPELTVSFFETLQDALSNANPIGNMQSFTNTIAYYQEIFVRVEDPNTGCFSVNENSSLHLNVVDAIEVDQIDPLEVCDDDNDGFAYFDLDSATEGILGGIQNPGVIVTYHETQFDADSGTNALSSPYGNIVAYSQTLFARVVSIQGDCHTVTSFDLIVDVTCVSANNVAVNLCADDPNADVEIDLTAEEATILGTQNPSDFTISYYQSYAEAESGTNAITNPEQYTIPTSDTTLYVRVENNATLNYTVVAFSVFFNYGPGVFLEDSYTICNGAAIVLTPSINGSQGLSFLWSTGATDPEILVNVAGTYSVEVTDNSTNCSVTISTEVFEGSFPELGFPSDIISCGGGNAFDLTAVIPEVLIGQDANLFEFTFFNNVNDAFSNVNPIQDPTNYIPASNTEAIFVRAQSLSNACFEILDFDVILEFGCPVVFDCASGSVNNSFCYDNNNQIQYTYENTDGLPIQVVFNSGEVENNFDELVVLDSDGVTNLNANTPYGNDGDLTGMTFTATGNSITITIDSDGSISCESSQNITPIDYTVSCADPNALPVCNASLINPANGETDVNLGTPLSWSIASGVVEGYLLSIGTSPGGTDVLDSEDLGNVTVYNAAFLEYETTYYVTIVPYNANGSAENCQEESFTTRPDPFQTVVCEEGAVNTTYCYGNNDESEYSFVSTDGQPLTIVFNSGGAEISFDEIYVVDTDGSILNPDLPYGNNGDFTGLTYTSSGDSLTVRFDTDGSVSCDNGSSCCTEVFDFDVFCASSVGFIQVNAFVDANANSIYDANEFSFSNGYFTYEVNGDGMINTVNSSTGSFQIISGNDTDVYDITFNLYDESEACYDITIASFDNISVATGSTVTVDFPVVEEQSCEDLAVYLINNWAPPRPGFYHDNYLYLENLGFTNITSGTVEFVVDPLLEFDAVFSANPLYTITPTATGFTVDFVNLQPGDVEVIGISLYCPVGTELGDIVTNTATYLTDTNDLVASNNLSTLSEVVVGSWDPNDKMESHGPRVLYDEFSTSDEWLYYTIRFQNLGTAEAIFVRIEDVLDAQLDASTFQMLRASHDYIVTRTENNLEWFFDDIFLPAEQDDSEGSIGFVYFRIKPQAGYALGDIIPNNAAIYFDFNEPVITNTFETEFVEDALSVAEFDIDGFEMHPNPTNGLVNIKLNNNYEGIISVIDISGKLISKQSVSHQLQLELDVTNLQSGLYFVKLETGDKTIINKLIKE